MRLIFFTCRLFSGIIKVRNLPVKEAEAIKDKLRILLRIALDSTQPFALVLPRSSGSVTFYGADGQPAEVRIVR